MTGDRPRITVAMLLLAGRGRIPPRLYRVLCRVYAECHEAGLRFQAARPARFRLMVSEGLGEPAEWVRYNGRYKIPIASAAEAVRRLTVAERRQPEFCWWIEHDPGAGWHRPELFPEL